MFETNISLYEYFHTLTLTIFLLLVVLFFFDAHFLGSMPFPFDASRLSNVGLKITGASGDIRSGTEIFLLWCLAGTKE